MYLNVKFGYRIRKCIIFWAYCQKISNDDLRMKNETTEGTEKGFKNEEWNHRPKGQARRAGVQRKDLRIKNYDKDFDMCV